MPYQLSLKKQLPEKADCKLVNETRIPKEFKSNKQKN